MNRPHKLLALLAVGLALIVAGCGDDDESTTESTTATGATGVSGGSLTKEEFVAQADQICAAGDEEITAAAEQLGNQPPEGQALIDFVETVTIPSIQAQHDAIAALPVPEGEEEAVDELLTQLQEALDALEADPELITEPDAGGAFEDVNQAAADFGLTNCGGDSE